MNQRKYIFQNRILEKGSISSIDKKKVIQKVLCILEFLGSNKHVNYRFRRTKLRQTNANINSKGMLYTKSTFKRDKLSCETNKRLSIAFGSTIFTGKPSPVN